MWTKELYTPRRVWNARSSGARLGLAHGLGARGRRPREESDLSSAMSFREPSVRLSPSRALESALPRPELSCPEEAFSEGCASGPARIGLDSPADFCLICHLTRYTTPWWMRRGSASLGAARVESPAHCALVLLEGSRWGGGKLS